jgi:nicotinate-nucleotide adenylyltransferase
LGGTFDPIHLGHLHIIEAVADRFDQLLVIPTGQPWLRGADPVASGPDRVEMCVRALEDLSDSLQSTVALTDIEVRREGPTHTVDTIAQLKAFFPDDHFTLILGSDAAASIEKWHKSKDLLKMVSILVVRRPGDVKSEFPEIEIDAIDISATEVRQLLSTGADASHFLSQSVLTYVQERGLYVSK